MTAHLIALTGRGVLAMLFILAGVTKLTAPKPVLAHMAQEHVPGVLLPVVALFEIAAGGALLIGWMTMLAAAALCVFCVATAIVFHRNFASVPSEPLLPRTWRWPARSPLPAPCAP